MRESIPKPLDLGPKCHNMVNTGVTLVCTKGEGNRLQLVLLRFDYTLQLLDLGLCFFQLFLQLVCVFPYCASGVLTLGNVSVSQVDIFFLPDLPSRSLESHFKNLLVGSAAIVTKGIADFFDLGLRLALIL